ncbi:MAG: FecR domain-containing protein [Kiritimatiellae bacterium]|nr:FecR domain-containing protein [Kiritimatiellia bacterium]
MREDALEQLLEKQQRVVPLSNGARQAVAAAREALGAAWWQARKQALAQCLDRVAGEERRILDLYFGGNLAVVSVAEAVGRSPESVKATLARLSRHFTGCAHAGTALGPPADAPAGAAERVARIAAYLDGTISLGELSRLDHDLCAEPATAGAFVEAVAQDGLLRVLLGREGGRRRERVPAGQRPEPAAQAGGTAAARPPVGRPRWGWRIAGLAAMVLLAAATLYRERLLAFVLGRAGSVMASVEHVTGEVTRRGLTGPASRLSGAVNLEPGDRIRTIGPGSSATVRYPGLLVLQLGPDTAVRVGAGQGRGPVVGDPSRLVYAETGALSAYVKRAFRNRPVTLVSPHARIAVLGTRIELDISAHTTRVLVVQGQVWMANRRTGQSVEVHAGAAGVADAGSVAVTEQPPEMRAVAPDSVPGLEMWLDAGSTSPLPDGAELSRLPDKCRNGHDAVQKSAEKKPVIKRRAVRGEPALVFDGENDYLVGRPPTNFHDCTLIIVCALESAEEQAGVFGFSIAGGRGWSERTDYGTPDVMALAETTGNAGGLHLFRETEGGGPQNAANLSLYSAAPPEFAVLTVMLQAGTASIRVNGGNPVCDTYTNLAPLQPARFQIGCRYVGGMKHFNRMQLAELLFYTRTLADEERVPLERQLGRKYGIRLHSGAADRQSECRTGFLGRRLIRPWRTARPPHSGIDASPPLSQSLS